jgi:hypothetical protein
MVMSRDQNAGRSHSIHTENGSFERVNQFQYLETTLTNQCSLEEEIKRRLKSGNVCFHSVQNLFSSSSLRRNIKFKVYRIIKLPVVCYGCETLSLTLRLRVFENWLLRRIFGPKRDIVTDEWRQVHNDEIK